MAQIHGGRKTSRVCARRDFATFLQHILSAVMMTPQPRQAPGIPTDAYLEQGRRGVKTGTISSGKQRQAIRCLAWNLCVPIKEKCYKISSVSKALTKSRGSKVPNDTHNVPL